MSLDLTLVMGACECCGRGEEAVYSGNFTHNVTKMWSEAGCYDALYMSEGFRAETVTSAIVEAVVQMEEEPDFYRMMSDPGGWGTYEQAIKWLKEVRDAFLMYPQATIHVCK